MACAGVASVAAAAVKPKAIRSVFMTSLKLARQGLLLGNSTGAPEVPHGTSCSLLTRHHAQAPAVLDHSCALPQRDGGGGPAFARGAVRCECNLVVLDARDVFDDAFAVRGPGIDAEGEVSSRCGHVRLFLPQSASIQRKAPAS